MSSIRMSPKRVLTMVTAAALVAGLTTVALAGSGFGPASAQPPTSQQLATAIAEQLIAGHAPALHVGKDDTFVRHDVISAANGLQYVPYDRRYRGLPVVGGDFVISTDAGGHVLATSVAQAGEISLAGVTPALTQPQAETAARGQLSTVDRVESTRLVVDALDGTRLAWESVLAGKRDKAPSHLHVFVDALSGKVLRTQDDVMAGEGTGKWNGPSPLAIGTTSSGGSFRMADPNRSGLTCGDTDTGQVFTDADDRWGDGVGTNKVTGCVDAMFVAGKEWDMLREWLGRNGIDGNGRAFPITMGDPLGQNAHWTGSKMTVGINSRNEWISALDVVGHEFGHAIDQFTPGGTSANEASEFVADVYGAATEAYANESTPYDVPDYTVGETINLNGSGPIRNMYNPSLVNSDPNCYSSSIPGQEVHKAAGPGNHWFYLTAEGSNPGGGKPTSPTCNSTTVTGVGIQNAAKIFYNAMLLKTSGMTYLRYRTATLQATKNLFPGSCTEFNTVKAAWDAVSVPAQSGDPTCAPSSNDFSIALSPASGTVQPGQSTSATVTTQVTQGSTATVNLAATVSPSGPSVSVSPSQIQSGGTATLNVATATGTTAGTYTITVTGTGPATHAATFTLTVGGGGGGTPPDIDVAKVKTDLSELNTIAGNNGGNRRAGSGGHTQSVTYLEDKLRAAGFTTAHQRCTSCSFPSDNLIADWPGGPDTDMLMFGAHLDSVSAGPGINDNGSGSATLLEVALALAKARPTMAKHVRFGWWTGEEQGLQGSQFYVNNLTSAQQSAIKGYYNFDMVGSPNGGYFINHLTATVSSPLKSYWDSLNLQPEENTEGAGRSDDASFAGAGIPTSGYAAGASNTKTSAQAAKWGGTANQPYDSCYHQSCDTASNINDTILDRSADGVARAVWTAVGSTPTPVSVADPGHQFSTANQAINPVTLAASGGTAPYTWSATGLPAGLSISASGTISGTPTMAGDSNVTVTARDNTGSTGSVSFAWTVNPPGGGTTIANGDFEIGNLTSWTVGGAARSAATVSSGAHGGGFAARLGTTTATNGDSTLSQTFTAPAGSSQLSFWYNNFCPDTVTYAWAKATLVDNTAGTTGTPLARTCTQNQGWKQVSVPVTAGHSYTLTLVNRDDNFPNDPVYTLFDDVTLS